MTSTIKVDNIQDQDGNNIINENSNTITIGASGDTVTLASGASQTGFGRTGTVDWDTTAKTAAFTAVSGNGYFVNTTSGAITVTLPASPSAGDIVAVADYANTADTNNITIARNGSPIEGGTNNHIIDAEGGTATLVYVDGTQGWRPINSANSADLPAVALFTVATGGTITTCGDYKIHTFTGPGTFCVSQVGNAPANPSAGPNAVSYMVVAGGGGGANGDRQGGGGAGGFREGRVTTPEYSASPLATTGLTITATAFPITVGGGGAGGASTPTYNLGSNGDNSIFSTITSTGGGGAGSSGPGTSNTGNPGGSGGGAGLQNTASGPVAGGLGNTPPVSPPQGNPGGEKDSGPNGASGGGGGAGAAGGNGCANAPGTGGVGGAGVTTSINGSPVTRAGGGGGGGDSGPRPGGTGGGGAAKSACSPGTGNAGTANTGGGGGGTSYCFQGTKPAGAAGGSGIVVIRYKFQ